MRKIVLWSSLILGSGIQFSTFAQKIQWVQTTQAKPWQTMSYVKESKADSTIVIDVTKKFQKVDGIGGCFNEMGWEAMQKLSATQQNEILQSLFNTVSGCGFNMCRMPIGASDYALDWYSHNENSGDYKMEKFSIDRDKKYLLPYIKAAQKIRPDLRIWASPWSPPSWMKLNNSYRCVLRPETGYAWGKMNEYRSVCEIMHDSTTLSSYTLYFSKFLQAYKKEGVNVYAIHVQNEPDGCQPFPSCIWNGSQLRDYVKNYMGPFFKANHPDIEIWLGTINSGNYEEYTAKVLNDKQAAQYITGVGYQWDGKRAIAQAYKNHPDKKLMQTENECGDGKNSWDYAEYVQGLIKHYFENGVESYLYWNMTLPQGGVSTWGWKQNSMITIDTTAKTFTYAPEFYVMKHLSAFVKKGYQRVSVSGDASQSLAFLSPDNELVIFFANKSDKAKVYAFKSGKNAWSIKAEPHSFHSFKVKL